jgi:hypothetical protein
MGQKVSVVGSVTPGPSDYAVQAQPSGASVTMAHRLDAAIPVTPGPSSYFVQQQDAMGSGTAVSMGAKTAVAPQPGK